MATGHHCDICCGRRQIALGSHRSSQRGCRSIVSLSGIVDPRISAVAQAAGGSLNHVVKLNLFLTDLAHFAKVNEIMATYFAEPYPARAAVGVASLPRGAGFEAEAVMVLPG